MQRRTGKIAGVALCVAALGTVARDVRPSDQCARGPIGPIVHGGMIILLSLMTWGLVNFAIIRGPVRPLISAGLLAFGISLIGHIAAATINGFVVPALAASGAPISHDVLSFAWHANQSFALLGIIAGAVAFVLWSIELLGDRASETKIVGAIGLTLGLLMIALPATKVLSLKRRRGRTLYALQALWVFCLAWQMVPRQASPKRELRHRLICWAVGGRGGFRRG